MAFKIAYCAGHHLGNSKGVPVSMGLGDIREWTLNDRVADHFAKAAQEYEGVELLRTDDPTGQTLIDIPERCAAANNWGADIYIDMHHNGGINGGTGGGVCAFSYPGSEKGRKYRDAIYDAVIAAGGLKGNRSQPKQETAFQTLKCANMPAVLMEYGFMDSKTDAPIIIKDAYSKLVAYATMEGVAKVAGLKKKVQQVKPAAPAETSSQIYRIRKSWNDAASQVGAFVNLDSAKSVCPEGYTVYDKNGTAMYTNAPADKNEKKHTPEPAKSFTRSFARTYKVNSSTGLKLRTGAGTTKNIIETMPNGSEFICYGYHTGNWLYGVSASGQEGYCHNGYLVRK